jgi:hypothetical protein
MAVESVVSPVRAPTYSYQRGSLRRTRKITRVAASEATKAIRVVTSSTAR